jgi:hypothetical protein
MPARSSTASVHTASWPCAAKACQLATVHQPVITPLCRNGFLNKQEFARFAESLGKGTEYAMFHWLDDQTVDELFKRYAGDEDQVSFNSFQKLVRLRQTSFLSAMRLSRLLPADRRICESGLTVLSFMRALYMCPARAQMLVHI